LVAVVVGVIGAVLCRARCGNFHRRGCSLDVGLSPLGVGSCPAVMWWPLL